MYWVTNPNYMFQGGIVTWFLAETDVELELILKATSKVPGWTVSTCNTLDNWWEFSISFENENMYSFFPFISNQLNTSHGPGIVLGTDYSLKNLLNLSIISLTELRINDYVLGYYSAFWEKKIQPFPQWRTVFISVHWFVQWLEREVCLLVSNILFAKNMLCNGLQDFVVHLLSVRSCKWMVICEK